LRNFQKSPALGAFRPQRSLTFNIGHLKLRDLVISWFSKLIITKSNFKI